MSDALTYQENSVFPPSLSPTPLSHTLTPYLKWSDWWFVVAIVTFSLQYES